MENLFPCNRALNPRDGWDFKAMKDVGGDASIGKENPKNR